MSFLQKLIEFFNNNKKIVIINAGSIVVVLVAAFYFFISPLSKENAKLREIKITNDQVLASQQLILAKKDALKSKVERLRIAIPDDPQLLKLGSNLQNLAVKNGLLVKTISFGSDSKTISKKVVERDIESNIASSNKSSAQQEIAPQAVETKNSMSGRNQGTADVTVRLAGSDESFKKFLQSVETNLRLIDIIDMTLPGNGNNTDNTYSVNLRSYYWSSQ